MLEWSEPFGSQNLDILTFDNFWFAGESSGPSASDPIAMMEYYVKRAAQEERKRAPKLSKDEMPPPASLQGLSFNHYCCRSIFPCMIKPT